MKTSALLERRSEVRELEVPDTEDRSLVPEVTDGTVGAFLFGTRTKNDALGGLKPKSRKEETEKGKLHHAGSGVGAMGGHWFFIVISFEPR